MQSIKIGLIGFGTVGAALDVLRRNSTKSRGRGPRISCSDRRGAPRKAPARSPAPVPVYSEPAQLIARDDIDIVVELIGGCERRERCARTIIAASTCPQGGCCRHGNEIFEQPARAEWSPRGGRGGGIPIIKALARG